MTLGGSNLIPHAGGFARVSWFLHFFKQSLIQVTWLGFCLHYTTLNLFFLLFFSSNQLSLTFIEQSQSHSLLKSVSSILLNTYSCKKVMIGNELITVIEDKIQLFMSFLRLEETVLG